MAFSLEELTRKRYGSDYNYHWPPPKSFAYEKQE